MREAQASSCRRRAHHFDRFPQSAPHLSQNLLPSASWSRPDSPQLDTMTALAEALAVTFRTPLVRASASIPIALVHSRTNRKSNRAGEGSNCNPEILMPGRRITAQTAPQLLKAAFVCTEISDMLQPGQQPGISKQVAEGYASRRGS